MESSIKNEDVIANINGIRVLFLDNAISANKLPQPEDADVWVINHYNEWSVRLFLRNVIRSKRIDVYLKPIFLQEKFRKFYSTKSYLLESLCDGYIEDKNELERKLALVHSIHEYVEENSKDRDIHKFRSESQFLLQKWFDYYFTRQKNISPILNIKSLSGYSYPRIEAEYTDEVEAYHNSRLLLRYAFKNNLVKRIYKDTCHLCHECRGGFLNYREVCPRCGFHDLKVRNLIHHFRCAYVGPDSLFINQEKLICPKCYTELKNLGVDYDRPGRIYICNNNSCHHEFQDAPVGVNCINCNTEQLPSDLVAVKVYEYQLTQKSIEEGLLN